MRLVQPKESHPLLKNLAEKQRQANWHHLISNAANAKPNSSTDFLNDKSFLELILMKESNFGDSLTEQETRNFEEKYVEKLRSFRDRVELPESFQDWLKRHNKRSRDVSKNI